MCRGHGFDLWSQKIPHTVGQLSHNAWSPSPRARALQQGKRPQWEACAPQLESSPHSLELRKTHLQSSEDQHSQNKK